MLEICPLASRVRRCAVSAARPAPYRMREPGFLHARNSLLLRPPFAEHLEAHPCSSGRDLPSVQTRGLCHSSLITILLESKSCTNIAGTRLESYSCKKIGGAPPLPSCSSGIKRNSRIICTSEIIGLKPPLESALAKKQMRGVFVGGDTAAGFHGREKTGRFSCPW
jgi:hypothetical protein